jgi:hypothetical protein
MTMLRNLASALFMFGWILAWGFAWRREIASPAMASATTLLFGVAGIIAGLYFFSRGFVLLHRKKWIEDTPVTRIAAAPMGQVKVFGKATGPYTLLSPLGMVDCHYYRAEAYCGVDQKNGQQTNLQASESLFTPLFVEDESGILMIDPRGAQLELPADFSEVISQGSMEESLRRFLRRRGLSTMNPATVSEYTIKPGDPLLVLGALEENSGAVESAESCLSPEGADLQRREQLDAMGIPYHGASLPVLTSERNFDLHPRVILGQGGGHSPFVLSRQQPQRMVADLQRKSIYGIWGGPALALFSLGLLMKWLGVW